MCVHFNYNAGMLVNTYKNEQILSLNTSAQYRQCLQCYCYKLTAMPTRQSGNQLTHKKASFNYECFLSTDDVSRRHSCNTAKNNYKALALAHINSYNASFNTNARQQTAITNIASRYAADALSRRHTNNVAEITFQ